MNRKNSERFFNRRIILPAALLVLALGLTVLYTPETPLQMDQETGEYSKIVLGEVSADLVRPSISSEGVKFVNNASHSFNVRFDRSIEGFRILPGESKNVEVDSITYYNATPVDEGRMIKGSIYVE